MKNKRIVISSLSLFALLIILCPLMVEAKTYYAQSYSPMLEHVILYPGDIIDFSNVNEVGRNFYLFLNGEKLSNDCFSSSESCLKQYTVTNKMIYINVMNYSDISHSSFKLQFYKLEDDDNQIYYYKSGEENYNPGDVVYYKSGDLILFTHIAGGYTRYFIFDENDNLIETMNFSSGLPLIKRLPKINNKDVYWKCEYIQGGSYSLPEPYFTPIDYTEPKIELKCDKDKINYGEKTKCEVSIECTHVLNKLEFSMNQKNLKFTNYSFLNGITNTGNNNSIKLNITDNNICNEKKTIMTFDVEGTKNSTYLDKLSLNDIEYTDELLTAKYNDLDSNLNIISTNNIISNPKTGTRIMFIIIPIIILLIVGILSVFKKKNKATN